MTEVKKGGLIALIQGTIKVVLIIAGLIACQTRSFPSALEKRRASSRFLSLARFQVDFNGRVQQSPSVVASDSEGGMDEV